MSARPDSTEARGGTARAPRRARELDPVGPEEASDRPAPRAAAPRTSTAATIAAADDPTNESGPIVRGPRGSRTLRSGIRTDRARTPGVEGSSVRNPDRSCEDPEGRGLFGPESGPIVRGPRGSRLPIPGRSWADPCGSRSRRSSGPIGREVDRGRTQRVEASSFRESASCARAENLRTLDLLPHGPPRPPPRGVHSSPGATSGVTGSSARRDLRWVRVNRELVVVTLRVVVGSGQSRRLCSIHVPSMSLRSSTPLLELRSYERGGGSARSRAGRA
jgi:hypothetical protein